MKQLPYRVLRFYYHCIFCIVVIAFVVPELAAREEIHGESLRVLTNRGLSRDRYDPRTAPGLIVPSLQLGEGTLYDYETFNEIRVDYYPEQRNRYFLAIPGIEGQQINVGGERYLNLGGPRNRFWLGGRLSPIGQQISPYLRGVRYLSRRSKIHYLGELNLSSDELIGIAELGLQTYPFQASRHSYIDLKARGINHQLKVSDDQLDRRIQAMSISIDLGHGWARFAGVRGLEVFGLVGIGHSRLRHSTANCIGNSCEFQGEDTELRMMVGVLFQSFAK